MPRDTTCTLFCNKERVKLLPPMIPWKIKALKEKFTHKNLKLHLYREQFPNAWILLFTHLRFRRSGCILPWLLLGFERYLYLTEKSSLSRLYLIQEGNFIHNTTDFWGEYCRDSFSIISKNLLNTPNKRGGVMQKLQFLFFKFYVSSFSYIKL